MEEIEKGEGGITIGQIFRTIFSQKWLALVIAAIITIVGTLGLYFMGKSKEVYSVSFVLQLPGADSSAAASYTYPDGSSFYYTDLKSADKLKEVASRDGFKGIDVDKIIKQGDISISLINSQSGVEGLGYTITVKSKHFSSKGEARDFIEELASIPCEYIGSMNINYDKSLSASKVLITYDGQLDKLKEQAEYILTKYNTLIEEYGDIVVKDGNSLSRYQSQLQTFLSVNSTLDNLKTKALEEKLVMGDDNDQPREDSIEQYEDDILTKKAKRDEIKKALDRLYSGTDGQTSVIVDATVLDYALQLEQLNKEIEYYETNKGQYKFDKAFDDAVTAAVRRVEGFTTEYAEVSSIVYKNKSTVNYLTTGVVDVSGGRSIVMSVCVSLVAGIILAAIVAYTVGWSKQKKAVSNKSATPVESGEPSDTEDKK